MLLNDEEKQGKLGVLKEIGSMLASKDHQMIGEKRKKPIAAEVSMTTIEPKDKLGEEMKAAGHEGVESEEAQLFPEEEAKEDAMMGGKPEDKMLGGEGTEPSQEELSMIKELYHRYFG